MGLIARAWKLRMEGVVRKRHSSSSHTHACTDIVREPDGMGLDSRTRRVVSIWLPRVIAYYVKRYAPCFSHPFSGELFHLTKFAHNTSDLNTYNTCLQRRCTVATLIDLTLHEGKARTVNLNFSETSVSN